jgi:hypothetical protein
MNNKKIPTSLGTIVLIIIAVTVFGVVGRWDRMNKANTESSIVTMPKVAENNQQSNKNITQAEDYPTVQIQENVNLEEIIKQAIFKKFPEWKTNNYTVSVTVKTNEDNFAIGKFVYDNNKRDKYYNSAEEIWFASKSDNAWTLITTSAVGYWGTCQDFEKFNFPTYLTPDCWDIEKNILVYTTNPQMFYEGFTKFDIDQITQAFVVYANKTKDSGNFIPESYLTKKLYARINKKINNYTRGTILVDGSQNISAPEFFAVKQDGKWTVVFNGQDYPNCNIIKPYKFPHSVIEKCYDEQSGKLIDVL